MDKGPPPEGRDLLTRFGTRRSGLSARSLLLGGNISTYQRLHLLFTNTGQLCCCCFLQGRWHNLVTLILTCVTHTRGKKKKSRRDAKGSSLSSAKNNNYTCISPSRKICLENSAGTLTILPEKTTSSTNPSRTDAQRAKLPPRGRLDKRHSGGLM